jgi:hypothetical protein
MDMNYIPVFLIIIISAVNLHSISSLEFCGGIICIIILISLFVLMCVIGNAGPNSSVKIGNKSLESVE